MSPCPSRRWSRRPLAWAAACLLCLTAARSHAAGEQPPLGEFIDFVTPLEQLATKLLDKELQNDRKRYAQVLETYIERCRARGKANEADYKLAERAHDAARTLQKAHDTWASRRDELERIRLDQGLMKSSSAERDQQALKEKIERKTRNLITIWEGEIAKLSGEFSPQLRQTRDLQEKLNRAVSSGVVSLKGARPVALPPPSTTATAEPAPPPVTPPAPVGPTLATDPEPPQVALTFNPGSIQTKFAGEVKTPPHLIPAVTEVATWLEHQQRRANGKLASRLYAEQGDGKVTLFLQMTDLYKALDNATQLRLAEGIWQYWALRCNSTGVVRRKERAHLVLVDDARTVLGLSSDEDGSVIRMVN